jgi:HTH-type transcriptional regulator, glycine betaine synthesis regulator
MSDPIHNAELLAADAIGDVIEHWGFRKALGRVWTVLFLDTGPLPAAEIADRLSMSAGAVSTTLAELQRWGVARRVWKPGERREYFEAETDFWKMISRVVSERERFLAESVRTRLDQAAAAAEEAQKSPRRVHVVERIRRLSAFAQVAESVLESFIRSQRADFQKFGNLLSIARGRLGAGSGGRSA